MWMIDDDAREYIVSASTRSSMALIVLSHILLQCVPNRLRVAQDVHALRGGNYEGRQDSRRENEQDSIGARALVIYDDV